MNNSNPLWNCQINKSLPFASRRSFLVGSALGFGAMGLADVMASSPKSGGKAKRVIQIFLQGGCSHLDTFDYKPELKKQDGNTIPGGIAFGSPFEFKACGKSGLMLSDAFGPLSRHADLMCVINSQTALTPDHNLSTMEVNTGSFRFTRPSVGSWVLYGLGSENKNLPAFVSLRSGGGGTPGIYQSAFLPGMFQGVPVNTSLTRVEDMIANIKNKKYTPKEQRAQLDLLNRVNTINSSDNAKDPQLEARIESYELAFKMQTEASDAFDTSKEPESVKSKYGTGETARQLLVARRLSERGVRFVQVVHGSYDFHSNVLDNFRRRGNELGTALAGLIDDLKDKGMINDTLIVLCSEFGRTSTRDDVANGNYGRAHWNKGFSTVLIGGGVNGGVSYGKTDELGQKVAENEITVPDLHGHILAALGFNPWNLTYDYNGRPFRLIDVHNVQIRKEIIS